MVFEIQGFKQLQKSPLSPNKGEIMARLYWSGEVLASTPIATYTVIFIQIGQPFRKISTDKLFRTHRQPDRLFFFTPASQKRFEISKRSKKVNYWIFKYVQIWLYTFFRYLKRFWDISIKRFFKKNFVRCCGLLKRLDLGQITFFLVFFLILLGIQSPLDSTVVAMFSQN